jgi:hypothetical protein
MVAIIQRKSSSIVPLKGEWGEDIEEESLQALFHSKG